MTELYEKDKDLSPKLCVPSGGVGERIRNIGTLCSPHTSASETLKRLVEEFLKRERYKTLIVCDDTDDLLFVRGTPSGKSSLFTTKQIADRCNKVQKPTAAVFAKYARFLPSGGYRAKTDREIIAENGILSVKGFAPASLFASHPELYEDSLSLSVK